MFGLDASGNYELVKEEVVYDLIDSKLYDSTLYPPLENVPYKFAISKRNEWMINESDLIIAFELLEAFFLACNRDSDLYPGMQQGDNGQSIVLGGMTPDGQDGYNLLHNNCEHFAYLCVFGEKTAPGLESVRDRIRKKLNK